MGATLQFRCTGFLMFWFFLLKNMGSGAHQLQQWWHMDLVAAVPWLLNTDPIVMEHGLSFQQHRRRPYTWTSPDGQYRNQIDYILCSQRWRCSIQSVKIRHGADCGSDHEVFFAKFRIKLKKVGKTTRPFRYDLNQIPYDYTVKVTNRFKGLDLIRVPEKLWAQVTDIVQEVVIKTIPRKKKCKRQNGCLKRP